MCFMRDSCLRIGVREFGLRHFRVLCVELSRLTPGRRWHDEAGYHVVGDDWRVGRRRRAHERIDYVVGGRAHHTAQLRRLRAR